MSIYLDCNATTPIEPQVVEKINQYLTKDFGNEGSHTHMFGTVAKQAVQEARDQIVLKLVRFLQGEALKRLRGKVYQKKYDQNVIMDFS